MNMKSLILLDVQTIKNVLQLGDRSVPEPDPNLVGENSHCHLDDLLALLFLSHYTYSVLGHLAETVLEFVTLQDHNMLD